MTATEAFSSARSKAKPPQPAPLEATKNTDEHLKLLALSAGRVQGSQSAQGMTLKESTLLLLVNISHG